MKKQNYFCYDTLQLQKSICLTYWGINYDLLSEQININNYLSSILCIKEISGLLNDKLLCIGVHVHLHV